MEKHCFCSLLILGLYIVCLTYNSLVSLVVIHTHCGDYIFPFYVIFFILLNLLQVSLWMITSFRCLFADTAMRMETWTLTITSVALWDLMPCAVSLFKKVFVYNKEKQKQLRILIKALRAEIFTFCDPYHWSFNVLQREIEDPMKSKSKCYGY